MSVRICDACYQQSGSLSNLDDKAKATLQMEFTLTPVTALDLGQKGKSYRRDLCREHAVQVLGLLAIPTITVKELG